MKYILSSLVRQFLFWMLFFAFARLIFLLYYLKIILTRDMGFFEVFAGFGHALRLDAVAASYIIIFPFFLLVVQSVWSPKWLNLLNKIYTLIILLVYSLITTAELGIYEEWKTKLPAKALLYLGNPGEIYKSSQTGIFILLVVILVAQVFIGFYSYQKIFYINLIRIKTNYIFSALFLVITPGFILMGLRGGLQQIPIVQSNSYYSGHHFLNVAATNSGYNLLHSVFENKKYLSENPYVSYVPGKAKQIVMDLYKVQKDTTIKVLTTDRPNIVLFIMESWSADLIEDLGGLPGITPQFKKLENEGIFFTNFWANGTRSEQGMASIFSSFPAHPVTSITIQPDKYAQLPSIVHVLKDAGYFTSFYFGGQLIYGNIKGYIYFNRFDRITEIYNFPDSIPQGKLGIHDQYVFERQQIEISTDPRPFFSTIFSTSTHSPYDMPMKIKDFLADNLENLYLNSAWYADSCIGDYITKARLKDWYDNTLFIIMADHSRSTYRHWDYHSPNYHKTFLLMYGNVIKKQFRGTKVDRIGAQVDLTSTLLHQLNIDSKNFTWSKNLINPTAKQFASVAFEEGIGWMRPQGYYFYDKKLDYLHCMEIPDSLQQPYLKEGKAYLQELFQQYMDY
ncbi:MAG: sulfatase-like hydrolase/transferase [Bacteroidales bacterium]|nr:sulfatase-like hydrolase/transferase [Bacteroidales bacterium]